MTDIQKRLLSLGDEANAAFQAKLTPTVAPERFLGVRVPQLRALAREIEKEGSRDAFLAALPHTYYDEDILHAVLLGRVKDYGRALSLTERFLPYVDNWAVCDTMKPNIFAKHTEELLPEIRRWIASDAVYTCRFSIDMLMTYYLDEHFLPELLELPARVESEEYYVRMMAAWYYATALAKQWEAAVPYLEEHRLPVWTHNKTIQKAIESYRISDERKNYLRTLRIRKS